MGTSTAPSLNQRCPAHTFWARSSSGTTLYPKSFSASSMPPCSSPTVAISLRSTPIVTSVCAISGDRPVTITVAPSSREASTVWTRWFEASRLLGATVIVTGLSPEIAQTLVTIGVDLSEMATVGDLQGGIEEAERLLGYKVVPQEELAPKA